MKKLYIVFDQIPSKVSGGLIATYLNLVKLLNQDYEIHIISIFDANNENKDLFKEYPIHVINNNLIDMRFYKIFSYLLKEKKNKEIYPWYKKFIFIFFSYSNNKEKNI